MAESIRRGPRTLTPEERLEAFHLKYEVDENGCWVWTAFKLPNGYGVFCKGHQQKVYAHRWSYEWFVGPIPDGLVIDHLCRNRACCNPAHLEPVTSRENSRRGIFGVLTTHCPRGHPYDEANTLVCRGKRSCRTCSRAHNRRTAERRRRELWALGVCDAITTRGTPCVRAAVMAEDGFAWCRSHQPKDIA